MDIEKKWKAKYIESKANEKKIESKSKGNQNKIKEN